MLLVAGPLGAQTLEIQETDAKVDASAAGSYDKVLTHRTLEAGHTYAIVFAAGLDGYWFGPDAHRLHISAIRENADGQYEIACSEMADDEDFQPGTGYLVTPSQDEKLITHMTPGIRTSVQGGIDDLYCIDVTGRSTVTDDPSKILQAFEDERDMEDAPYYDILGHRLMSRPTAKGIYIHKGKKFTVE